MKNNLIVITTTCPDQQSADQLVQQLLTKQLAACIQQTFITSDYIWEGKQERSSEIKLEVKTLADLFDKVNTCIHNNHPYDCPEVIAVQVITASDHYANWLRQSVKTP